MKLWTYFADIKVGALLINLRVIQAHHGRVDALRRCDDIAGVIGLNHIDLLAVFLCSAEAQCFFGKEVVAR